MAVDPLHARDVALGVIVARKVIYQTKIGQEEARPVPNDARIERFQHTIEALDRLEWEIKNAFDSAR